MEKSELQIIRKGQWPVLLYEVREPRVFCASVFIEDNKGTIVIDTDFDQQETYSHWWGAEGRAAPTLRDFLCKTNEGYLMDKFSYGKERWCLDAAETQYNELLKESVEDGTLTADQAEDLRWDELEVEGCRTGNELYAALTDHYTFNKLLGDKFWARDCMLGSTYANPKAEKMVRKILLPLIEFWKKEKLDGTDT